MAEKKSKKDELVITRSMPKNNDAEKAVLGAVLIDRDAADSIVPQLQPEDFYSAQNSLIFEAMQRLLNSSDAIDILTVSDTLEVMGKIEDVGGIAYLTELSNVLPSAANADFYLEMVKRDSMLRRIIAAGNQITKIGYAGSEADSALSLAEQEVFALSKTLDKNKFVDIASASAMAIDEIEKIQSGTDTRTVVHTGFSQLDSLTNGFKGGEFILIAARPSVGKTAFALNIAVNAALTYHKSVAIFSLEMSNVQLVKRMLSYISKVSLKRMNFENGLSRTELRTIYRAHESLIESHVMLNDGGMISPNAILSQCRRLKRSAAGLDLVIIDYLGLMKDDKEAESRQQDVQNMSRKMKLYAKELNVPFLVLSQMSRDIDKRPAAGADTTPRVPKLSDLRDSGAIEQDADMVMFLHKPSRYDNNARPDLVQLRVEKNRNGELRVIDLLWNGETTSFSELVDENATAGAAMRSEASQPRGMESVASSGDTSEVMSSQEPLSDDELPF